MNGPPPEKFRDPSLVDFGTGPGAATRRLELVGGVLVDRPLPLPDMPARSMPACWSQAAAVFSDGKGWTYRAPPPDPWLVHVPLGSTGEGPRITLEVRPAPSGQIGVFLEQVPQWQWLFRSTPRGARVLSLFAHSGAATLAAAAAGAEVVHVDASKQAIALARRNAAASGLDAVPIRWLCEDARSFVAREVRRGAGYDAVVLDPPSWGHGPKGQAFSIDRDLEPLLADLARLRRPTHAAARPGPLLLTSHSPRWHQRRLRDTLAETFALPRCESGRLTCTDAGGRDLPLGDYVRFAMS
jgi:23S rRNA (cytosine1962-C5)-methyltransferase